MQWLPKIWWTVGLGSVSVRLVTALSWRTHSWAPTSPVTTPDDLSLYLIGYLSNPCLINDMDMLHSLPDNLDPWEPTVD